MGLLDDAIREHLDLKRRRGADPTEIERAEREALGPVRREPSMSAARTDEPPSAAALSDIPPDDFVFATESGELAPEAPTTLTSRDEEPLAGIAAPDYTDPDFDGFATSEPPAIDPPATSGLELEPAAPIDLEPEPVFEPVQEPEAKPKRRHLFGRHRHDEDERPPLPTELPEDDPFLEESATSEPAAIAGDEAVSRSQPIGRDQSPPALRITPETEPGNTIEYDVEEAFREEDQAEPVGDGSADEDILEETPDFLADTPDHDRLWFEQKPPPDFDFDS